MSALLADAHTTGAGTASRGPSFPRPGAAARHASLRDRIAAAEAALDDALTELSDAAQRVVSADDALADLIGIRDDA